MFPFDDVIMNIYVSLADLLVITYHDLFGRSKHADTLEYSNAYNL